MNNMNQNIVSVEESLEEVEHVTNQLFTTIRVNRTLLYGSTKYAFVQAGWNAQRANNLENIRYVTVPDSPALESLTHAMAKMYGKHTSGAFELQNMLEECFSQTNWYCVIQERFQSFKAENKLEQSVNKDLLAAFEVLLDLCVNARIQSAAICKMMDSVAHLKSALDQEVKQ